MSWHTWTPAELSAELGVYDGIGWRIVECQHRVATLPLVDTLDEQSALEDIIESTKPNIPEECRGLHYLLFTPFRYGAPYPVGSRFRRAGVTPGVFYASEHSHTAIAELAFYRLLFFVESPGTPFPKVPGEYTAFSVALRTQLALDLTKKPLDADGDRWEGPQDYSPCQELADAARQAGTEIIRYRSVRDPQRGRNLAVLTCRAFANLVPLSRHSWRLRFSKNGVQAVCEEPREAIEFDLRTFASDPRLTF